MGKIIKLFLLTMLLSGCVTTATRDNGETIRIRGLGSAEWPDGTKIEGKPLISFPKLEIE